MPPDAGVISLSGLLGGEAGELTRRLGPPTADRRAGGQRWLVWELEGLGALRVRCAPRIASWSLTFEDPLPRSLREAASWVDLWPELGPEPREGEVADGLLRREVRDRRGRPASATASVDASGVRRLAIFDEEPDW